MRYAGADRLRDGFLLAGYTVDGVAERLGPDATSALGRHETVPARRATTGGDRLDTLIRMFLLQLPVGQEAAARALPLDAAVDLGVLYADGDEVHARLDVRPYGEDGDGGTAWWVVSDLGTGLDGVHRPLAAEHVLGVGGASTTLAQLTPRTPVGHALDVGTGCGVQALHASRHSDHVVATDVSARALQLARLTAALSGIPLDLRPGDLLDPVAGEEFDLVVSNPPFVIGAPAGERHTYRDGGRPLDQLCAALLGEGPARLAAGGTLVTLANWVHRTGADWSDRVASWLPAHGVDALVVQRDVLDPAAYVATWLGDAGERGGPSYLLRYDEWLGALAAEGVDAVGLGFVVLRRTDEERRVTTLDWPHPVEAPLGQAMAGWLDRARWLARHETDDALAAATLLLAPDVVQEQVGAPGSEDPAYVVLRQQSGLRRAFPVGTATAALVGASDGTLQVGALIRAVAQVLAEGGDEPAGNVPDPAAVDLLAQVRLLVEAGVLTPSP
ncbi:MAG TPA: methyltransferase [Actinomycetes bacterium]|jgi:methylase of polypeptide subunit release factors